MRSTLIFLTAAFASFASAANLVFASGSNCTGTAISGAPDLDVVSCQNITWQTNVASVVLSAIGPGQGVTFYSDDACTAAPVTFTADTCYSPGSFGSFVVTNSSSPTTDIEPYFMKLSNYSSMEVSPYAVDATFPWLVAGIGGLGAVVAANIGAFVYGCEVLAKGGPSPPNLFACLSVPIATACGIASGYAFKKAGYSIVKTFQAKTGTVTNVRTLEAEGFNEMWADMILNTTDFNIKRVGYLKRDMGEYGVHLSPALEIDHGDPTGKWHVTAHFDHDSDSFIHHIQHASEWDNNIQSIEDRAAYKYNSIRWAGHGLDFSTCTYQGSDAGFAASHSSIFGHLYKELECYEKPGLGKVKFLMMDLYSEQGNIKLEMHFAGYDSNKKKSAINDKSHCLQKTAPFNQDCVAE